MTRKGEQEGDGFPRIAVINTGWSDDYRSGVVRGSFGYLAKGVGHEKFNFLPCTDARFYAYTPPLGEEQNPPKPVDPDNWLVFAVSKRPGRSGLYLVGWYESASFARAYLPRPDAGTLGEDSDGGRFSYTLSAPVAYAVSLPMRDRKIKGDHIKRSYAYLRGNGQTDAWRGRVARQLLAYRDEYLGRLREGDPVEEQARLQFCGSAARRKQIEDKAVAAVERYMSDWHCKSREADKCGYDLLLTHKTTSDVLHIEVKGTALDRPHFFITAKERDYACKLAANDGKSSVTRTGKVRPRWKLAMVHDVDRTATVTLHTFAEMEALFDVAPYAFHGTLKTP